MRRRILFVTLSAVGFAILLLGVPLAFAIRANAMSEEHGELERAALQAVGSVSPSFDAGDPVELPSSDGIRVALYGSSGARISGDGPPMLEPSLRGSLHGTVGESTSGDAYVASVPVRSGERVIGVVRTSSSQSALRTTVAKDLLGLAALAVVALVGAGLLGYWLARRLSRPLEQLASAATDLGAGDFSVRLPFSGVPELDRTGAALTSTAVRLSEQIDRERAFASQASHQLRTPLTRLQLELEEGLAGPEAELRASAIAALATAEELGRTVDDVLALARRKTPPETFHLEPLLSDLASQWLGTYAADGRPLRLILEDVPPVSASPGATRQILQVLLDNAWRHGAGEVRLLARETGSAVAVDVHDRGTANVSWPEPDASPQPLGLAMARSLAEGQDGRLLLSHDDEGTTFTLLMPTGDDT